MTEHDIEEEERPFANALAWHQSVENDEVDWDAFTLWLEGSDLNREAYDAVALIDDDLTRWPVRAANDIQHTPEEPPHLSRRWWIGGIAAAAVATMAVPVALSLQDDPAAAYVTQANEQRIVALADGSRVVIAPGSALWVKGNTVALASGAAWFDIRHDPSRQLTVTANGWRVTDIGTRFEAKAFGRDGLWVAVAHGSLSLGRGQTPAIHLRAGEGAIGRSNRIERLQVTANAVGGWRAGRLDYQDTPLAIVTADLSRYAGVPVNVGRGLEATRFTGSLSPKAGSAAVRELADILGARVVETPTDLTLVVGSD